MDDDGTLDPPAQEVMLYYEQHTSGWLSDVPHDGSGMGEAVVRMLYVPGYQ